MPDQRVNPGRANIVLVSFFQSKPSSEITAGLFANGLLGNYFHDSRAIKVYFLWLLLKEC